MGPSWFVFTLHQFDARRRTARRQRGGRFAQMRGWARPAKRLVDSIAGPPPDVLLAESSGALEELSSAAPTPDLPPDGPPHPAGGRR